MIIEQTCSKVSDMICSAATVGKIFLQLSHSTKRCRAAEHQQGLHDALQLRADSGRHL